MLAIIIGLLIVVTIVFLAEELITNWMILRIIQLEFFAKEGRIWVQAVENEFLCVVGNSGFSHFITACSDPVRKQELIINHQGHTIQFVKNGQLGFIGWPGSGLKLKHWYEFSNDTERKDIDPEYFLSMKERVIIYSALTWNSNRSRAASHANFIEMWSADTKDEGIQVHPSITLRIRVENAYKALYGVDYYAQSIQQLVASKWKDIVSKLSYSTSESKEDKDALQLVAQTKLRESLGVSEDGTLTGVAKNTVLDTYGVRILGLEITDINISPKVREIIQKRLDAKATRDAMVIEAEGKAKKKALIGAGEAKAIVAQGQAHAQAQRQLLVAKGEGLKAQLNSVIGVDVDQTAALDFLVQNKKYGEGNTLIVEGSGGGNAGTGATMAIAARIAKETIQEQENTDD